MNGLRLSRVLTLALTFILVTSLLSACGGDDDGDTDPPVPDGADQIGEAAMSAEDIGDVGVELSDGRTVAYRVSDTSLDDVAAFYESDVEDDGWTVVGHEYVEGVMFAILSKDMTIVVASATTGASARDTGSVADFEELDIDQDDLADDDILVAVADVTCEEDDLATCLTALDFGF